MVRTSHGIWHPRPQNEDSYADGAPVEQEFEEKINKKRTASEGEKVR